MYKLRQQRKGYLSNLTKCLNRANTEVELPNSYKEVFMIIEKIDFVIMKLERVTNEICSIAPDNIQRQANILFAENKTRGGIVLAKCKEYVNTVDNLSQSGSSTSAIDEFFDVVPYFRENDSKGSNDSNHSVYSKISSRSSNASSSERQYNTTEAKLNALQVEVESKRKLESLKERNKLEEAEVLAEITAAREKLKIAEMFETLYESKQQRSETIKQVSSRRITNLRPSTSYLAQNDEERQTYLIYISLHHIDQRIRHIDHLPHTQYIVAHQPT